jgi:lipopolysaccharide/colanic/teichoic acid biosynthesis glycosyltransferase
MEHWPTRGSSADARDTIEDLGRGVSLTRRPSGIYARMAKPALDAIGAMLLMIVLAPILVVIALAVRIVLGPQVLFRQERVGRNGRTFTILKFRSMLPDRRRHDLPIAKPDRRSSLKHPDDPRHTRLGSFLRTWSLDELPQLWNIMRGDMSFVGPRPEILEMVERHDTRNHPRHFVRPGLTGVWQVTARRGFQHEYLAEDAAYVEHLSFRNDLLILLRTPAAALWLRRGC